MIVIGGQFRDLTGFQFGKFKVIKQVDKPEHRKQNGTYWLCRCECGRERIIIAADINREQILSCGECSRNIFKEMDNYYVGYTTKNQPFYFDKGDYETVRAYTWCINKDGYVVTWNKETKKLIYMHRLLCNLSSNDKYDVDHMNHRRQDNRRENIRVCLHKDNGKNLSLKKNNTSGVTGVRYEKKQNKWYATIMVNYKSINLGYFDDFSEAVKCRYEAEEKYFGKYSYNNSITNGAEIIENN